MGDGNLWVRVDEGGSWVEQPLDISEVLFNNTIANYALVAGPAGIVLTFYSNPRQYAAFLPAGAAGFEVRPLGGQYELAFLEPASSRIEYQAATSVHRSPPTIHPYDSTTQTRWSRGEFKVQLNLPNHPRPMGFCDGSPEDVADVKIHKKQLKSGREVWTLGEPGCRLFPVSV